VAHSNHLSQSNLAWQSKTVLLVVMPVVAAGLVLQAHWWATQSAPVAIWTIGLSLLLALVVLKLRAATPAAATAGAAITANLMFSTVIFPYTPWQTALPPVLAVSLLAWVATRLGRQQKERLGTAEKRRGRAASQVAANLGVAALASNEFVQSWLTDSNWFAPASLAPMPMFAVPLAALAEAAADTVSSEIGQVLGGRPRMLTTFRQVDPGNDGAISLAGTLAGLAAAGIVAGLGTLAMHGGSAMFWISCAGAAFGMFFDSLLGATLERRGWLNNDAVNFLSTAGAAAFALGVMALLPHAGSGQFLEIQLTR
jgi:uncharacterized protein (TIGR00297 family)